MSTMSYPQAGSSLLQVELSCSYVLGLSSMTPMLCIL